MRTHMHVEWECGLNASEIQQSSKQEEKIRLFEGIRLQYCYDVIITHVQDSNTRIHIIVINALARVMLLMACLASQRSRPNQQKPRLQHELAFVCAAMSSHCRRRAQKRRREKR